MTEDLLELFGCRVDLARGRVHRDGSATRLSPREAELLAYLVARSGQVVPREELHRELWGHAPTVLSRAADVCMRRLRTKVEANPARPLHLVTVRGDGYRFDPLRAGETPRAEPVVIAGSTTSSLFGRDELLDELRAHLAAGERLLTLVGPPGSGKTRLLRELQTERSDAVWLELAEARTEAAIVQEAALVLRVTPAPDPRVAVPAALAGRGPTTLLLDNLEQVAEAAARLVPSWLAAAPELSVVATSRSRLRVEGERVVHVGSLAPSDAVAMLLERAGRVAGPLPEDDDARAVAAALDGLPLALELAAGDLAVLSMAELRARVGRPWRPVSPARRDLPARHRTLDKAIGWSWDLLDAPLRDALHRCSVFRAPFALDAARAVLGPDAPARLAALANRCLVQVSRGPMRFGLLGALRRFVADAAGAVPSDVRHAHAAWFAAMVPEGRWDREDPATARRLAPFLPDLVAALASAGPHHTRLLLGVSAVLDARDPRRFLALAAGGEAPAVWLARGRALRRIGDVQAADRAFASAARAAATSTEARYQQAGLRARTGDLAGADRLATEALERSDDPRSRARVLTELGWIRHRLGQPEEEAAALLHEALHLFEVHGPSWAAARALGNMAIVLQDHGHAADAEDAYARAAEGFREAGDDPALAALLNNQATLCSLRGDPEGAIEMLEEASVVHERMGHAHACAVTRANLCAAWWTAGRVERARQAAIEACRLAESAGDVPLVATTRAWAAALAACVGAVSEAERLLELVPGEVGGDPSVVAARGHVALARGERGVAEAILEQLREPGRHLAAARFVEARLREALGGGG